MQWIHWTGYGSSTRGTIVGPFNVCVGSDIAAVVAVVVVSHHLLLNFEILSFLLAHNVLQSSHPMRNHECCKLSGPGETAGGLGNTLVCLC